MTKLEEAERAIRVGGPHGDVRITRDERKAIADELDRLRADLRSVRIALSEHDGDEKKLQDWAEIRRRKEAELAALKGEAERTVYVGAKTQAVAVDRAGRNWGEDSPEKVRCLKDEHVHAVRLSATRVKP